LLDPIAKPNIPSSIDTSDEQKTDEKPKYKKMKKKKNEGQDNPDARYVHNGIYFGH
jgi:hypothetical protein